MASLWQRYLQLLVEKPYTTKTVTATTIMIGGDAISQGIEHKAATKVWLLPVLCVPCTALT